MAKHGLAECIVVAFSSLFHQRWSMQWEMESSGLQCKANLCIEFLSWARKRPAAPLARQPFPLIGARTYVLFLWFLHWAIWQGTEYYPVGNMARHWAIWKGTGYGKALSNMKRRRFLYILKCLWGKLLPVHPIRACWQPLLFYWICCCIVCSISSRGLLSIVLITFYLNHVDGVLQFSLMAFFL